MSTEHKKFFGRLLASIGNFLSGGLKIFAHAAVAITEEVKTIIGSGLIQGIAVFLDTTFKTHLAEDVIAGLNKIIPHLLAVELAVEGLPDNPTEQDILDFETRIYTAFTGLPPLGQSKLFTTFGAQVYGIIKPQVDAGTPFTFFLLAKDVEEAYQDYLKDVADNSTEE